MACPGSYPSCHGENDSNPKSGQHLDPDKLGCVMACQRYVTNPAFLHTSLWFSSSIPQLLQLTLES